MMFCCAVFFYFHHPLYSRLLSIHQFPHYYILHTHLPPAKNTEKYRVQTLQPSSPNHAPFHHLILNLSHHHRTDTRHYLELRFLHSTTTRSTSLVLPSISNLHKNNQNQGTSIHYPRPTDTMKYPNPFIPPSTNQKRRTVK